MRFAYNFGIPGLIQSLSPELRDGLMALGVDQRYGDKQHIQSRGDQTRGFSIIREGAVCFGKTDRDGRFIATAVLEPGQCYGEFPLFAGLPRTHDGFAVGQTRVSHISQAKFDRFLAAEPTLASAIISSLTIRLHGLLEWADDLRRHPLKVRLGKALLQMLAENSDGSSIPVTQSELADLMAVSRVAVAQTLADYRKRGFVKTGYGGLSVSDPTGLETWLAAFVQLDQVVPERMMLDGGTPPTQ